VNKINEPPRADDLAYAAPRCTDDERGLQEKYPDERFVYRTVGPDFLDTRPERSSS